MVRLGGWGPKVASSVWLSRAAARTGPKRGEPRVRRETSPFRPERSSGVNGEVGLRSNVRRTLQNSIPSILDAITFTRTFSLSCRRTGSGKHPRNLDNQSLGVFVASKESL